MKHAEDGNALFLNYNKKIVILFNIIKERVISSCE